MVPMQAASTSTTAFKEVESVKKLDMLQGNTEMTDLFDLDPSEELLERFACALLQTYSCSHNDFTPEQQVGHRMHPMLSACTCKLPSGFLLVAC